MNDATEIFPDLWIGNSKCIEDMVFLTENKFQCIINCTKDIKFNNTYMEAEQVRLSIDDHPTTNLFDNNMEMFDKLSDIVKYIHHYLCQNKPVLVYCSAGKQRSPTVVAAYIMQYGKVTAKQAIEYIKSKSVECFEPRVNFYLSLQKFEEKK
jgi:dual specificity MAP kinase phosphatase